LCRHELGRSADASAFAKSPPVVELLVSAWSHGVVSIGSKRSTAPLQLSSMPFPTTRSHRVHELRLGAARPRFVAAIAFADEPSVAVAIGRRRVARGALSGEALVGSLANEAACPQFF